MEKSAVQKVLEEHHQLLELQARIVRRFAESIPCGFDPWIVEIRKEVGTFAEMLGEHFRQEEQDHLHEEIEAAVPNAAFRLGRLLEEHASILVQARKLASDAAAAKSPADGAQLAAAASEFFAALDAHERSERELFLLAIEGEQGAPD